MIFDNHDHRIKYYELMLKRDLKDIPEYQLPEGYHFVFYRSGDRDHWIEIEKSAKEFESYEQGFRSWKEYYEGHDGELVNRLVFIENAEGEKVATATAYYDVKGRDQSGDAWLHWVAVRREEQGRGLAKPLISYVLHVMRELGYTHAKIPTQTTTWLACKVYLDLGFVPISENMVHSYNGWKIVKALTNHPALSAVEAASLDEILGASVSTVTDFPRMENLFLPKSTEELYQKMVSGQWKGTLTFENDQIIWKRTAHLMFKIHLNQIYRRQGDFWVEGYVEEYCVGDHDQACYVTHWHPAEDEIYQDLCEINDNRYVRIIKEGIFGKSTRIVSEKEYKSKKYRNTLFRKYRILNE